MPIDRLNRRDMLGAAGGAGLVAIAAAAFATPDAPRPDAPLAASGTILRTDPRHPDAALFAACAEFERIDRQYEVTMDELGPLRIGDAQFAKVEDRLFDLAPDLRAAADEICDVVPATLAGHSARAAAALRRCARFVADDPADSLRYLPDGVVYVLLQQLAEAEV